MVMERSNAEEEEQNSFSIKEESKKEDEYQRWKSRKQNYIDWKKKHRIDLPGKIVRAGDKVDVRDTEYIWCTGMVELKV